MSKKVLLFGGVLQEPIWLKVSDKTESVYVPYQASEELINNLTKQWGKYGDDRPLIFNMKYSQLADTHLFYPKSEGQQ